MQTNALEISFPSASAGADVAVACVRVRVCIRVPVCVLEGKEALQPNKAMHRSSRHKPGLLDLEQVLFS